MVSLPSKVIFSLGVVLILSAIGAIYITTLAQSQNGGNQSQGGSTASSTSTSSTGSTNSSQGSQNSSSNSTNNSKGSDSPGSNSRSPQDNTIIIPQGAQTQGSKYYDPLNAKVKPNSKITFTNKDNVAHTATADDGSFDTSNIQQGASKSITIKGDGTIPYHCTIHPWMKGKLIVSSGTSSHQNSSGNTGAASASSAAGNTQKGNYTSSGNQSSSQGGSGSSDINAEGFQYRTSATAYKLLPTSKTELGTESNNKDNWISSNHDIFGTRHSLQTTIDKGNVKNLHVKWIFNTDFPIEVPPLIIGKTGYAQNNAMQVLAFDMNTGFNLWKFDPHVADQQSQAIPRGVYSHGITYNDGTIFAPTGANGTLVALNATDGKILWQSAAIGDPAKGFRLPSPPIVWKDFVIAGSALGDEPPFGPAAKGSITAFNRTDGEKIWNISTVVGPWVSGKNASENGGATVWSGGSLDPKTGILYVPTGNAAPDFDEATRPPPNLYTNSILAIDVKTGQILWHTRTTPYNTHDWDTAWGTSLANISNINGTVKKAVIGQNKMGNGFALDAVNGHVLWNKTLGIQFRTNVDPQPLGSGATWPGTQYGVEDYNANDGNKTYFAVSNMGFNYFKDKKGTSGHLVPLFDAIENGVGNGTIFAVDIKTGNITWKHDTYFPTWVSPLVSGGLVYSGHITATGKPYKYNDFGAPTNTPLTPSGVIFALDKDTGQKLWEFNVGAPIGIGGPSIGNGTLLVTTGSPAEIGSNKGGYIVAFSLPLNNSSSTSNLSGSNFSKSGTSAVSVTSLQTNAANLSNEESSKDNNTKNTNLEQRSALSLPGQQINSIMVRDNDLNDGKGSTELSNISI